MAIMPAKGYGLPAERAPTRGLPWSKLACMVTPFILLAVSFYSTSTSSNIIVIQRWVPGLAEASFSSSKASIGTVTWQPCPVTPGINGVDCGHIIVPKDYFNHSAGTVTIALGRYRAKVQPSKGTVFFNPGGPGGSGKSWMTKLNPYVIADVVSVSWQYWHSITYPQCFHYIGAEYDIVGFDPRGVGETLPQTKCFDDKFGTYISWARNSVLERGYDATSDMSLEEIRRTALIHEAEVDALLRTRIEVCARYMGDELKYMGTTSVVRDIEFMSKIFDGEDALINFYGLSYGAVLGQYLVNMLPNKVGRIVIDGVVNTVLWASQPAYLWHRQWLSYTEDTYDLFFAECSKAGPRACALTVSENENPLAIKARLEGFLDGLHYQPLGSSKAKIPSILTTGRARRYLLNGLYRPATWPLVAAAFARAMKGDGALVLNGNEPSTDRSPSRMAVTCADQPLFEAPTIEEVVDERLYVYQNVSRFAFAAASLENDDVGCQYWPKLTLPEKFQGPWNHTLNNPILVLSNTLDPITPISSGRLVQQLLGSSARLLIVDSPGHTATALPSLCLKLHMNTFYANGTLPPEGTVCPVNAMPFPKDGADSFKEQLLDI